MKILRYLFVACFVLGLTGVANAFQFTVLDPSTGLTYVDPGVPFAIDFGTCPANVPWDGCFSGYNESNVTLTSLLVTFPNIGAIADQGVQCDVTAGSLFTTVNFCGESSDSTEYIINLSGGPGIAPGYFLFVEDGVDCSSQTVPCAFPPGTGVANTPEPSSVWMALSGLGSLGYVLLRKRRIMRS